MEITLEEWAAELMMEEHARHPNSPKAFLDAKTDSHMF